MVRGDYCALGEDVVFELVANRKLPLAALGKVLSWQNG